MKKSQCQNSHRWVGWHWDGPRGAGGHGGCWEFPPKQLEPSGEGEDESGNPQEPPPCCSSSLAPLQETESSTWHLSGDRVSCLETPNCAPCMAKVHLLCLWEGQKHWSINPAIRPKQEKWIGNIKNWQMWGKSMKISFLFISAPLLPRYLCVASTASVSDFLDFFLKFPPDLTIQNPPRNVHESWSQPGNLSKDPKDNCTGSSIAFPFYGIFLYSAVAFSE